MAGTGKVERMETSVHIKASAEEFHEVYCSHKTHQVSNACADKVQSVHLHDGQWGNDQSILLWNYDLEGKKCVCKTRIGSIDKDNKTLTFTVIEGDMLEEYKSLRFLLDVTPQEKGGLVHWVIEYEKLEDHIPHPHSIHKLITDITKDVDAHLTKQAHQENN